MKAKDLSPDADVLRMVIKFEIPENEKEVYNIWNEPSLPVGSFIVRRKLVKESLMKAAEAFAKKLVSDDLINIRNIGNGTVVYGLEVVLDPMSWVNIPSPNTEPKTVEA